MKKSVLSLIVMLLPGCGGETTPVLAAAGPVMTFRVSVAPAGHESDSWCDAPSISPDGRFVAFESASDLLAADDANGELDVYVRDLVYRTTVLVSAGGNGFSHQPAISADGRFVAFSSRADNLVPGDTNNQEDVFVRDLAAGTTIRVSVDSSGVEGDGYSHHPSISADGRSVAFESRATNLVRDDTNDVEDIFIRDLREGVTRRVSVSASGVEGDGPSLKPAISGNGRFVVYESEAGNLATDDTNECADIFRCDTLSMTTVRASVAGNGDSRSACVSADGRFVAFESWADNLQAGDANLELDVFLRDMELKTTTRVSVTTQGLESDGPSRKPSLSADGLTVAFWSTAANLVPGDTNGEADIFVRNLRSRATLRVSVDSSGVQGEADSYSPALASDGRHVAFRSNSDLVTGDTNGHSDIFVRGPLR